MQSTRVAELLAKLAAPTHVLAPAPVVVMNADYVEKLAAAVEFVLGDEHAQPETPTQVLSKVASPVDMIAALREKLRGRLQEKTSTKVAAAESQLVDTVLGRLAELRQIKLASSAEVTPAVLAGGASTVVEDSTVVAVDEDSEVDIGNGDDTPVSMNLADLLQSAVGGDGTLADGSQSVPEEGAKTASATSGDGKVKSRKEAVDLMKSRILAGHQGR